MDNNMTLDDSLKHIPRKYSIFEIDKMRNLISNIRSELGKRYYKSENGRLACMTSYTSDKNDTERELRTLMLAGVEVQELQERFKLEQDKNHIKIDQILHDATSN